MFYEVFVRSFADGDGDGVGDLAGLTSRLDYLNDGDPASEHDLGIEGLWLMPIFESPSYHGYDTTDYEAVDVDYGSAQDLRRLIDAAHARGIRVIVDLMINHTSARHPWFEESARGPSSPRRDWYVWRDSDPGWRQPWGSGPTWHERGGSWYYGLFWGGMPDLNFRNPEVRAEVLRIADHWLAQGLDGFRLDAARHLIEAGDGEGQSDSHETREFWREFSVQIRARHPRALLVGEIWSDTATIARYYGSTGSLAGGDGLPMTFNFPLAEAMVDSVNAGDGTAVLAVLREMTESYPSGALDGTFLTNHDMKRVATELDGVPARMRSAAALLLTLPGTPFLYYGEEVGLRNGPGDEDEFKRTPMPWRDGPGGGFTTAERPWHPFAPGLDTNNVAAQTENPDSLLSLYRRLIRLRASSPALRAGTVELLEADPPRAQVLAFLRREPGLDGEAVVVLHNLSPRPVVAGPYRIDAPGLESLTGAEAPASDGAGGYRFTLGPSSWAAWRLSR